MKVTFVLPVATLAGGIRVVAIYADRLKKRGHDVTVISVPHYQPTWKEQVKSLLQGRGWLSYPKRLPSHMDNVDVPHYVIDRDRPVTDADLPDADVVIATWWETAEWVAKLSPAKGAKAYFLQHHEVFDYLPVERVKATWRLPLHKITISKWLVDLARDEYGDTDVTFVPNSVDTEQFYAPRRSKQPVPTVGMLYATPHWKGCAVSLKAFDLASQKIPNLRMVAFGTYPLSPELPLPANSDYFLKPEQQSLRDIYAQCDVWLCGSWSEGFHLPPLEAMACRCPVVSTAVGGPLDIIVDGVNGYLAPCGDAKALAEKLVQVLSMSNEEWQQLSDRAYETVIGYTWDDATDLFEKGLYRAIERSKAAQVNQMLRS
ncbi:MAG: glycosyltransferase family 4 protein [Cyanobacteria bacterium]|nr:glycosyltransferase family 4 protein [Cyanobacteriota bacterium]MDW8199622.1 glycosyltransferase family 4 protein [Cyanobacteriota bacterium SKYGB_h_bin112]